MRRGSRRARTRLEPRSVRGARVEYKCSRGDGPRILVMREGGDGTEEGAYFEHGWREILVMLGEEEYILVLHLDVKRIVDVNW